MYRLEVTAIVVDDLKLFAPGGDIARWATGVGRTLGSHARREAPVNKRVFKSRAASAYPVGALQKSISARSARVSARVFTIDVSVNVPYALHVIYGTKPRIYSRSARVPKGELGAGQFRAEGGMRLPANPGYGGARTVQSVRGQRANNFLGRAFDATARKHSSLRGFQMND